ncbi:AMP-binding protein [Porticoccaceae bacterium]|nr:AMP-binding protein [Porticoccaceae bacterium]MDB9969235.1 AMP-binding protein [Porticoccaceae bacterium]MDC1452862.1 AMP-binding protein [Porticoccaceae bacterium]
MNNATSASPLSFAEQKLVELNAEDGFISLVDAFNRACEEFSDRPAFTCMGQTLSFTDMELLSRQFGCYLLDYCGLVPGDRVAVQLPNISQYPISIWGILRAGLVVVNTNPMYTAREQLHQFNDSGAKALVVLSDLLPVTEQVIPQTGVETVIATSATDLLQAQSLPDSSLSNLVAFNDALALGADKQLPKNLATMADVAVLQYTGGTTGPSKGAILSHGNVFSGLRMSKLSIRFAIEGEPDLLIAPMPLYHVFGFTMNAVGGFVGGSHSVLIPNARDIDAMVATMKQHQFTTMAGITTLLQGLMRHPQFDEIDFSKLRGIIAGGAALVKEVGDEWEARTGSRAFEGYGLSETTSVLACNGPDRSRIGTVGAPLLYQEVKLIDAEGASVANGERGEICTRGAHVMQGYWNRPEATAEAIDADGWFRTGDIGVMDKDGMVRIVDRLKDMVIVSGFNVYPNEIEDVAYGHRDIVECAVVGVADERTGEAVKLFVVSTNPDLTDQQVKDFCREQLTAYKVPKHVAFMDELPKSPVGKILRRELRV